MGAEGKESDDRRFRHLFLFTSQLMIDIARIRASTGTVSPECIVEMHTGCEPDPPGTINPAKLMVRNVVQPPNLLPTPPQSPNICARIVHHGNGSGNVKVGTEYKFHDRRASKKSRLPRISSEREIRGSPGVVSHWVHLEAVTLWRQFDQFRHNGDALSRTQSATVGCTLSPTTMHSRYYQWQTRPDRGHYVVPDPAAGPGSCVVVDSLSCSIWDAYMLRVDVSKNMNWFKRQQITYDEATALYTLWVREGCVGQTGHVSITNRDTMSCLDLKPLTAKFQSYFSVATGKRWEWRYVDMRVRVGVDKYSFVELDHSLDNAARANLAPSLPDYDPIYANIHGEVKEVMELMLHGGTDQINTDKVQKSATRWVPYTAPYNHLSHFTLYKAFTILKSIIRLITNGQPIKWKLMQGLTSQYRSQIPYCPKSSSSHHGPVVANYQSVLLELQLLSSLWPNQQHIQGEIADVGIQASMQLQQHGKLALPLYHAYSSLQHGFRRLTDFDSVEYRELCQYLHGSNHPLHRMTFEIQDIYRVFVKKGVRNGYKGWIESKQQPIMDAYWGNLDGKHHSYDGLGTNSQEILCAQPYPGADTKPMIVDNKLYHIPISRNEERLLLWHGTPLDSLQGILEMGLQIRRRGADFTGTMFGNGLYLADSSSKSAGFCRYMSNAYHSNTTHPNTKSGMPSAGPAITRRRRKHRFRKQTNDQGREAVLLLCEADVGKDRIRSKIQIPNGHAVIAAGQGFGPRCIQGVGVHGPVGWKNVDWNIEAGPAAKAGEVRMVSPSPIEVKRLRIAPR